MLLHTLTVSLQVANHRLRIIITTKPAFVLLRKGCVERLTGTVEDYKGLTVAHCVGNLIAGIRKKIYTHIERLKGPQKVAAVKKQVLAPTEPTFCIMVIVSL